MCGFSMILLNSETSSLQGDDGTGAPKLRLNRTNQIIPEVQKIPRTISKDKSIHKGEREKEERPTDKQINEASQPGKVTREGPCLKPTTNTTRSSDWLS